MITPLTPDTAVPVEQLGGKAAGLVRLLSAGLSVPEAWVIPAPVSLDPDARRRCDEALAEWWAAATADFPDSLWAVRSSAVAEDLADASFAGVYETVLGIATLPALRSAVIECWSAHDSERANVYRAEQGFDASGGIALVLQRMIRPEVAGVMLTANPHRPFADEIVIDAAWGLGEAVVSGKVDPDNYVLQRSTGALRSQRIATKCIETVYDGVLADREVEPARRDRSTLDEGALAALYAVAQRVGQHVGPARDVEWALERGTESGTVGGTVYVLQDRPITKLPSPSPQNVWSRKWGDEYKSEYTLPLSALNAPWMDIPQFVEMQLLQGRPDLARRTPLRMFKGYMYVDGQYVASMARAVPKPMRAGFLASWFTPLWGERIAEEPWNPLLSAAMVLAPWRDGARGLPGGNLEAMRRHCARIDTVVAPKLRQDYASLSMREWRRQMDEVEAFGLEHFRIIRWGMGLYNSLGHALLSEMLRRYAGDRDGQLYHTLISGLPGTRTAQINAEIWELGMAARADAELTAALRAGRGSADLRSEFPAAPFWGRFDVFIANHGHRSASRDIGAPRWREQPDVVLGLVRAQVNAEEPPEDPRASQARAAGQRADADQEALRRVGRGPAGAVRKKMLAAICAQTQLFTVYRENQRYHLDYLLAHQRALVLEQGRRLVSRGVLDDADDVFLLTAEQFWSALSDWTAGPSPIDRADLERSRRHYLTYRDRIPATFLFDDVETEGEIAEGDQPETNTSDGISGVGAAHGVARGRTRCIADLAQLGDVKAGEILVAKNIDPGWTSVFPMLAGLITETGGMLSHGAILAREYGIPTVTGVPNAAELLPTGCVVELDGTRGTVEVLDEAEIAAS